MRKASIYRYGRDLVIEEIDENTLRIAPPSDIYTRHLDDAGRLFSLRFTDGRMIQVGNKIANFFIEDLKEPEDSLGTFIVTGRDLGIVGKECPDAD